MVDIVLITDAVLQMQVIVNGSNNVFLGNMLRNQIVDLALNCFLDILDAFIFFQYLFQSRIIY